MKEIELGEILKQYRVTEIIDDSTEYKQITISQTGVIKIRGFKKGSSIGRKRQFIIDLKKHPNTLLFVRQGVQKGGIGIAGADLHGSIATENMPMFEISDKVNPIYLGFYLRSSVFKNKVNSIEATGTAQKSIHERTLLKIKINLPSRKEQDSLVKKLSETKRNFKFLNEEYLSQQENLSKLRQSILQDAVQGKLTKEWREQNPKVEPASELLKKIKEKKEQLVKEKIIRKEKPLAPITKNEIPYEIPESWEWCRFGDLISFLNGYAFKSSSYVSSSDYQIIRLGNVKNDDLLINTKEAYVPENIAKKALEYKLLENDILTTLTGTKNKRDYCFTCIVRPKHLKDKELYLNQRVGCIRAIDVEATELFNMFLKAELVLDQLFETETGTANQGNIGSTAFKNLTFPLPNEEEQKIIVEKVNQLLANCDVLEQEIKDSKTNAEKLMQSVLSELLEEENYVLGNKPTTNKELKKPSREIKYNSKTVLMDLVKLLKENGKLHAEDLWKMSKFPNNIDAFYAELKKQIEEEKAIKEVANEKGYLELV